MCTLFRNISLNKILNLPVVTCLRYLIVVVSYLAAAFLNHLFYLFELRFVRSELVLEVADCPFRIVVFDIFRFVPLAESKI